MARNMQTRAFHVSHKGREWTRRRRPHGLPFDTAELMGGFLRANLLPPPYGARDSEIRPRTDQFGCFALANVQPWDSLRSHVSIA